LATFVLLRRRDQRDLEELRQEEQERNKKSPPTAAGKPAG
jgi:hypothetical protein